MAVILVVDDRAANRDLLRELLGRRGHRIVEASDGELALALARADPPDLIIADILMPTMDGFELVRCLREEPHLAAIPVVFWTALHLEREARALAEKCKVAAILTKPSRPDEIFRVVDEVLGGPTEAVPATREERGEEEVRRLTGELASEVLALGRANERLEVLVDLGFELGSQLDPGRVVDMTCRAARSIVGARMVTIGMLGEQRVEVRQLATSGMRASIAQGLSRAVPLDGIVAGVLADGRVHRWQGKEGSGDAGLPAGFPPVRSILAVPVCSHAHLYGWLALCDKLGDEEFSDGDEKIAVTLAAQLGRIYENGSLYEQLRNRAEALEREVAERMRAEAAARERERHFQAVFEHAVDSMLIVDRAGELLGANPAAGELFGIPAQDLIGRRLADFVIEAPPEGAAPPPASKPGPVVTELGVRRQDGELRVVERSAAVGFLPGHDLVVLRDVTEKQKLEAQLRQGQRMEAVGQLAAGVAHDFNNLLTVIIGFSDLACEGLQAADPLREMIQEVRTAGGLAASLTAQLLAFSRQQILAPCAVDLNGLVADVGGMLGRLIGENIELVTSLDPALEKVLVDPRQIEQVIVNLAVNARDAMPQGGRLVLETKNVELDAAQAGLRPEVAEGRFVVLSVSDSGTGMDERTKARLFEPFFTTKVEGKGTGLGLATVHGIVKQSGGHVWVYSKLGQGTVFKIYLPVAETDVAVRPARPSPVEVPRGTETLLLVEDEDAVRRFARQVLEKYGYRVLEAAHADDALALCELHAGEIALMVTDVIMPRLNGPELARRAADLRPGMRVLYVSGYTDDAIVKRGVLDPGVAFLQKPYTPDSLVRRVREAIDETAAEKPL